GLEGGAGAIPRKREERQGAAEAFFPVSDLPVERVGPEPAALPPREVGVLNRERRERRRSTGREGRVERRDLPREDADRPAVGDDVMHRLQEDVLVAGQAKERNADERAGIESEDVASFCGCETAR